MTEHTLASGTVVTLCESCETITAAPKEPLGWHISGRVTEHGGFACTVFVDDEGTPPSNEDIEEIETLILQ